MKIAIDKTKTEPRKIEKSIRFIMATIFMICFLISLGYWAYAIYEVYETDIINIETIGEVWHYVGHQFVGFEAAILSFMLFYASLKI